MKSKKVFSFNEEQDATSVLLNGFPGSAIDYSLMYTIAKYFRQTFNYGEIRLEKELIHFCKQQDKNFNPVTEAETIKKWIKTAMNYSLRKIDSVAVSQKELDFLNSIENQKDRKILFVTLIMAKALKNNSTRIKPKSNRISPGYFVHYSNFPDIIRLSKIKNLTDVGLADIYHRYKDYLTIYNPNKELLRLNYADTQNPGEIVIENLNNISEEYTRLFMKEEKMSIKNCIICGKELIKKSNRQKTCPECSKRLNQMRVAKWRKLHPKIEAEPCND